MTCHNKLEFFNFEGYKISKKIDKTISLSCEDKDEEEEEEEEYYFHDNNSTFIFLEFNKSGNSL